MTKAEEIFSQDIMFDPHHGKQVIDLILKDINQHNASQAPFSFTPQFRAMLVIHITCHAATKFEGMNVRYEERHGIQSLLKDYKHRMFILFKNTVKEVAAEIAVADDFCAAIKSKLIEHVRQQLDQKVLKELYQAIGTTKYDLITKILDEVVQERKSTQLLEYVEGPEKYAEAWVTNLGNNHIFRQVDGQSKYVEFANHFAEGVIEKIKASTDTASWSIASESETHQCTHDAWISEFCAQMKDLIAIRPDELKMRIHCNIKNFMNYQKYITSGLQNLEEDIKNTFKNVNSDTFTRFDVESPFQKVFARLWGCPEHCPLCWEPCQFSDPNHANPHRCIQHRPPGINGAYIILSKKLQLQTCTKLVTSTQTFTCSVCRLQCLPYHKHDEDSPSSSSEGTLLDYHPYSEYKKIFPSWDIAPDPVNKASKFWQWAVCTFQSEIREKHQEYILEIPDSWKQVTQQEASECLREFLW